jgi:hypothetical protein
MPDFLCSVMCAKEIGVVAVVVYTIINVNSVMNRNLVINFMLLFILILY